MKKLYLFLILGIISCNLFCQQDYEMVLDSVYGYDWDLGTQDWQIKDRMLYTYNSYGDKIEQISNRLDPDPDESVFSDRSVYTYDTNRNQTEEIRYEWDSSTKDWRNSIRTTFAYNAHGNLTEEINYMWDPISNDWILRGAITRGARVVFPWGCRRVLYLYNEEGNIVEEINYGWDSEANEWIGATLAHIPPWSLGRKVFTYDTEGKIIEEIIYSWDPESNSWALFVEHMYSFFGTARRFVYQYDDSDNLIEKISYRWLPDSSAWVLDYPWSERSVYAYDSNGNLAEEFGYYWYNEWRYNLDGRSVYSYDVNGNLSECIVYVSDAGIQDWKKNRREVSYWSDLKSHTVAIPDTAFLSALIDEGVDTNGDSLISYAEAEAITVIDIDGFTGVYCGDITDITGIEAFINLETLVIISSSISKLDLSYNTALKHLSAGENDLREINISGCTELLTLELSMDALRCGKKNPLPTLDISNSTKLQKLWIGETPRLQEVCVWETFSLDSVEVYISDAPYVYFTTECDYNDSIVFIPDIVFLNDLIDEGVDTNGDSLISYVEAEVPTSLKITRVWEAPKSTSKHISNLTGIEAFTNLDTLILNGNEITNLDLSNNTRLKFISAYGNLLTSIDISNCLELEELDLGLNPAQPVQKNQLTDIDVTYNAKLKRLVVWANQLTILDLSKNPELSYLDCDVNRLTSLDVSNNPNLTILWCRDNQLSSLDVRNCTQLEKLYCYGNKISSLDLSKNNSLKKLNISDMSSLNEVCVGETFSLESVEVDSTESPNVYFTTECSDSEIPYITASESIYQPDFIEATSSVIGMIYLVPENTERDIAEIRGALIDSVEALSNTAVKVSLSGLLNGVYWLYARDTAGNISEPAVFEIFGVGLEEEMAGHFRIYPNPTSTFLTVETSDYDLHSIEIRSLNGQLVYRTNMDGSSFQIDFSSFPKGVYFIKIRSKNFVATEKIIKF